MMLPLLLEPDQLLPLLGDEKLLIVDVSSAGHYARGHIPGSVHLAASHLQCGVKPAPGKLPDRQALSRLFSALGLRQAQHVVIADDEGGGWAGRLAWTLDCIGHRHYSLLNGGLVAWVKEGYPLELQANTGKASDYCVDAIDPQPIATVDDILQLLDDPLLGIWDVRSAGEFNGSKVLAQRGGHIPGARHLEWTDLMDKSRNLRLLAAAKNSRDAGAAWFDCREIDHYPLPDPPSLGFELFCCKIAPIPSYQGI